MIILVYIDDCILISKGTNPIKFFVKSLESRPENFVFTDEGTLDSYLGVNVSKLPSHKEFSLSQPFLIDKTIKALNFDSTTTKSGRDNMPASYPLLNIDVDGPAREATLK